MQFFCDFRNFRGYRFRAGFPYKFVLPLLINQGIYLLTAIYLDLVSVLLLPGLFTVKLTVYFPVLLYTCTGFFSVELVPSPKIHFHEAGDPVLLSVKLTLSGADPEVGMAEKAATREFETAI